MSVGYENIQRFFQFDGQCFAGVYEPLVAYAGSNLFQLWPCARGKWPNILEVLKRTGLRYRPNDYFWFPDPDLEFEPGTIDKIFNLARTHALDLCQPALTSDSNTAHAHLYQQPSEVAPRKVPFVEVMCPVFSVECLSRNAWTFDLSHSGYGLDFIWGKKEDCFVLDNVTVKHAAIGDFHSVARKYGLPQPTEEMERLRRLGYL